MEIDELLRYYDRLSLINIKKEAEEKAAEVRRMLSFAPKTAVQQVKTVSAPTPVQVKQAAQTAQVTQPNKTAQAVQTVQTTQTAQAGKTTQPVKQEPVPASTAVVSERVKPTPIKVAQAVVTGAPSGQTAGTEQSGQQKTPLKPLGDTKPATAQATAGSVGVLDIDKQIDRRLQKYRGIDQIGPKLKDAVEGLKKLKAELNTSGMKAPVNTIFYTNYSTGNNCVVRDYLKILELLGFCDPNKESIDTPENIFSCMNTSDKLKKFVSDFQYFRGGSLQIASAGSLNPICLMNLIDFGGQNKVTLLLSGNKSQLEKMVISANRPGKFYTTLDLTGEIKMQQMIMFGAEYLAETGYLLKADTIKKIREIVTRIEPYNLDSLIEELDLMRNKGL